MAVCFMFHDRIESEYGVSLLDGVGAFGLPSYCSELANEASRGGKRLREVQGEWAMDFRDHVVLITGGATGIGLATGQAFGERGARVALCDVSADRLAQSTRALTEDGVHTLGVEADVRDRSDVERMVSTVVDTFGSIDICVANAGVYPVSSFLEVTEQEWDLVLDTNLKGTFLACQSVARYMVERRGGGQIVTIGSGAANQAIPGWSHYCSSKAALLMLTRAMALELAGFGIRVNSVLPGYIDVDEGGKHLSERYKSETRLNIPLGRPGTPHDVAAAVVMLTSPLAGFVTGAAIPVDGGSSAGRGIRLPTDL